MPFRHLGLSALQKTINSGSILPQLVAEIYHEGLRLSTSTVAHSSSLGLFGLRGMDQDHSHHQAHSQQQASGSLRGPDAAPRNIKIEFQAPFS
jgi:hypothetical protein